MVSPFYPQETFGLGGCGEELLHVLAGAVLIVIATDEELRLHAAGEKFVGIVTAFCVSRHAEADQALDPDVAAAGAQADVGAEGEACEEDGTPEVELQPGECGADVVLLALPVVECAFTEPYATEVEAEYGQSKGGEGLHGVVDDLVVHGSTAGGMGMADERGVGCVVAACVQQCLQTSCGAVEIVDGLNLRGGGLAHRGSVYRSYSTFEGDRLLSYAEEMAIDPIQLTKQLVDIESTTYHEGLAGPFFTNIWRDSDMPSSAWRWRSRSLH